MCAIGLRKLMLFAALTCLLSSGGLLAQEISWRNDLEQAKQDAAASGKLVMLHFGAGWCRPCRQVDSYVFSSPKIITAVNELVVPIKIDVDQHPELVKKFHVKGIPEDVFITPDEQVVQRMKSPTDAENFHKGLASVQHIGGAILQDKQRLADIDSLTKQIDANAIAKEKLPEAWRHSTGPSAVASPASQLEAGKSSMVKTQIQANHSASDFEAQVRQKYGLNEPKDALKPVPSTEVQVASPVESSLSADDDAFSKTSVTAQARPKSATIVNHFATALPPAAIPPADFSTQVEKQASPLINQEPQVTYALGGDCPVTLLTENRWVEGDKRFGCVHRGRIYLFESEAKQQRFLSSPDDFSPMLAGYDPVEFREQGKLVDGIREFGVVMSQNDRQAIVMFASRENAQKFKANPTDYLNEIRVAVERADESKSSLIRR